MRKSQKALISTIFCAALFPAQAFAGAWLQNEGATQAILSYSSLSSDQSFDGSGNKINTPNFSKGEVAAYIEHGFNRSWTVGGALSLQAIENGGVGGSTSDFNNFKVASAEFFARTYLFEGESSVLSIEPRFKQAIESSVAINPEGNAPIPELKLAYGNSFSAFGQLAFADNSLTYRYRSEDNLNDMVKVDSSIGIRPVSNILLLGQGFYDYTIGRNLADTTSGNYELLKIQFSAIYNYDDNIAFQAGYLKHIYGANTIAGDGLLLSTWLKF